MRMCPGNEAYTYAEKIIAIVKKCDGTEVLDQVMKDDMDIEELLKNDKAIMGGIVAMSKLITSMNDSLKRLTEALKGETSGGETSTESTTAASGDGIGTPKV